MAEAPVVVLRSLKNSQSHCPQTQIVLTLSPSSSCSPVSRLQAAFPKGTLKDTDHLRGSVVSYMWTVLHAVSSTCKDSSGM